MCSHSASFFVRPRSEKEGDGYTLSAMHTLHTAVDTDRVIQFTLHPDFGESVFVPPEVAEIPPPGCLAASASFMQPLREKYSLQSTL